MQDERENLIPLDQYEKMFPPINTMTVDQIKQKAKDLKGVIEAALHSFRTETGYTPEVKIETKERPTNDKKLITQTVTVTIQM